MVVRAGNKRRLTHINIGLRGIIVNITIAWNMGTAKVMKWVVYICNAKFTAMIVNKVYHITFIKPLTYIKSIRRDNPHSSLPQTCKLNALLSNTFSKSLNVLLLSELRSLTIFMSSMFTVTFNSLQMFSQSILMHPGSSVQSMMWYQVPDLPPTWWI